MPSRVGCPGPWLCKGRAAPGAGTVTIRGLTGTRRYEETIPIDLPEEAREHAVIATLWARGKIDALDDDADRDRIVALGDLLNPMVAYDEPAPARTGPGAAAPETVEPPHEPEATAPDPDEVDRVRRLARVLDDRLWPFAFGGNPSETLPRRGEKLLVAVLLDDVEPGTLEQLAAAGLLVEDRSAEPPLAVGAIASPDIECLAMLESVRRVEPVSLRSVAR